MDAGIVEQDVDGDAGVVETVEGGGDGWLVRDVEGGFVDGVAGGAQAGRGGGEPGRVAPAAAKPSAMAWPRPREEPVTRAVRPVRSNSVVGIGFPLCGPEKGGLSEPVS